MTDDLEQGLTGAKLMPYHLQYSNVHDTGSYLDMSTAGTKSFVTAGRSWSQMLVRILAAMVGLFLLDLLWLLLLAPLLGLDYFGTAGGPDKMLHVASHSTMRHHAWRCSKRHEQHSAQACACSKCCTWLIHAMLRLFHPCKQAAGAPAGPGLRRHGRQACTLAQTQEV